MNAWLLVLAALQVPAAPVAPPAQAVAPAVAPAAPAPEAYAGSLRDARRELVELSSAERHEEAQKLCAQLLAHPELERQPERVRAEVAYAAGVAYARAGVLDRAVAELRRCQGLAGSSSLGRDALYDAGTLLLERAEMLRLEIPEMRAKLGLPAAPPAAPQASAHPPPDALGLARSAYLAARVELAQRLRIDARDVDTRANLELLQRRLRELDELQQQRDQQQEQEQQQQKNDPDQKQDPEQQDPQKQDQQKQDPQQDPQQQDAQPQDPQKQDPAEQQPKPGEEQDAQPSQQDRPSDDAQQEPQAQADAAKEREDMVLTPEEVQRLMDKLAAIEEQWRQVQASMRERRRKPVKKDW